MTFSDENHHRTQENSRQGVGQKSGVKQAYNEGGIKAGATHAARLAFRALSRRKPSEEGVARLARLLTAVDLTALGVGSTLGMGVYVTSGEVAKKYAGPAVILSFLVAAVASVFAGLCYAEFGARVPKAGSAYVYCYVCVGEFIAFIIGWNLIMEYILGAAAVVKALSEYTDALAGKAMSAALAHALPMDAPGLAPYPDVFAFVVIMAFSAALSLGVKESTKFNNFCTGVNLCVVAFVIISGAFKVDPANWRVPASQVPNKTESLDFGSGGFAPHGIAGIMTGASHCFYALTGFDGVATAGEETIQPQKTIPFAIVACLLISFLVYFGLSTVLTMMLPYYLLDEAAPFPYAYDAVGWYWAKYAVSVGAVCALLASIIGVLFPLPRIIYAMSSDGLLFKCLGRVSDRFQTPWVGTMLAGLFAATLAMIFKLDQLTKMSSIGTLLAYSMVASCVLLLRYAQTPSGHRTEEAQRLRLSARAVFRQLWNADGHAAPTKLSAAIVNTLVTFYGVWCLVMMWNVHHRGAAILAGEAGPLGGVVVGAALVAATLLVISRQPVSEKKLAFSVPLVPWLPGVSVLINVYMMLLLDPLIWVRFAYWMLLGFIIYFAYGVRHSAERRRRSAAPPIAAPRPVRPVRPNGCTALLDHGDGDTAHAL